MERQLVVMKLALFLVVSASACISLSSAKTPTNGHLVMQNKNDPPQRVLIADPLLQLKLDVDPRTDEFVMAQKNYDPPQRKRLKKRGPALDQPTDELLMDVQNIQNDPPERKLAAESDDPIPSPIPIPANPYKRPCNPTVKCRTRRLLTPTPKVIYGPQHHVNSGN